MGFSGALPRDTHEIMRRTWGQTLCVGLGLSVSGTVLAAPPAKKPMPTPAVVDPAAAAQKTMRAQLSLGRTLAGKGKHSEAIAAFESALQAVPDEPRVLSELGVTLRASGNLPRAEEVCKKAVDAAKEPPLRASALYNLARVLSQKGDKPGAVVALRASLKLRENRIVRETLLDLDPTAQSEALSPEPLEGPLLSVDAWCKKQSGPCHFGSDAAVQGKLDRPTGPWLEAQVFSAGDSPEDCVLAVRTARGFYFSRLFSCRESGYRQTERATIETREILSPPGAKLLVTLDGVDSMRDFDEARGQSFCCVEAKTKDLVVCGVGPSGTPHCTRSIGLHPGLDAQKRAGTVQLVPNYGGQELVLERSDGKPIEDGKAPLAPNLKALAGRHRVVFP